MPLLDAYGRPMKAATLKSEVAAATLGGVRSPQSGYPADGMTPQRLALILREADAGDGLRYLELAQTIEERDLHYLGVLGTRRRSVGQLDVTVEAASDSAEDEAIAEELRKWLERDELSDEIFHILDCIGKGFSFTEIIWDTSEGQWSPKALEYRDPRWFGFDQRDLLTPMIRGESGQLEPLPGGKFIYACIAAKSGLPLRSGIARVAAWAWMFKAFTQRDWTIFTQTYAQPVRLGKYHPGATDAEKATLMRALANIAGDMAAMIPESMMIEFIEAANVGAAHALYKERSDWLDQQVSKAVLGQTATTDAVTGGLGSGKEHRQVQEDIERADAKALSAILNRDLVRPFVMLNHGPQKTYPRIKISRPEQEDLTAFADAVGPMIDRGLEVSQEDIREKFGLAAPKPKAKLMTPSGRNSGSETPPDANATDPNAPDRAIKGVSGVFKRGEANLRGTTALNTETPSVALLQRDPVGEHVGALTDRMEREAAPHVAAMIGQVEAMLQAAGSLEEFREMVLATFDKIDTADLSLILGQGMLAGFAGGRVAVEDEADG
jgi:phage gp29-like protein